MALSMERRRSVADGRAPAGAGEPRRMKLADSRHALVRALKLFALGMVMQAGLFLDPSNYTYGYNLRTLRFCGILNRIGFAYLAVALLEIWLPQPPLPRWPAAAPPGIAHRPGAADAVVRFVCAHGSVALAFRWQWLCAAAIVLAQLLLTNLVPVPTWTSEYIWNSEGREIYLPPSMGVPIPCDVRGAVDTPECSASAYFDRLLFGQNHLGAWCSQALPQCSSCSPGVCPLELSAPAWCGAHMYDPEGALSTLASAVAVIIGLYFGKVLLATRRWPPASSPTRHLVFHWSLSALKLIAVGLGLKYGAGIAFNKQLWSLSYSLWMTGTCGAALAAAYLLVDVDGGHRRICGAVLSAFQYLGMNAILVFFLHGPAEAVIHAVYTTGGPDPIAQGAARYTLITWLRDTVIASAVGGGAPAQLVYVIVKVICFMAMAAWCARVGYFWKL